MQIAMNSQQFFELSRAGTETIRGQKWVTISAVHPLLYKLLHISFNATLNDMHLKRIISIKESLKNNLSGRYSGKTMNQINRTYFRPQVQITIIVDC